MIKMEQQICHAEYDLGERVAVVCIKDKNEE